MSQLNIYQIKCKIILIAHITSQLYDSECAANPPLNYCLGLAKELLKNQNCKIYEESEVVSYKQGEE